MKETTQLKQFRAVCYFKTVLTSPMPIWAKDADEATEIAREKFIEHNNKWTKNGGNDRELLKIDIEG